MIRINLLKTSPEKYSTRHRSFGKILRVAGILVVAGICVISGIFGYRSYQTRRQVAIVAMQPITQKGLAPSTYSKTNMVEEVVKEVNDSRLKLRESGVLDLPYDQLSFAEKINYELLFAKNVCDLLSRIVPSGIGLKSLEFDNFQTVYAVGLSSSRNLIQNMLVSLKNDKVILLLPPYSFIKPAWKEGFRFAFSCKTTFGLNLTDPLVDGSLARLPSRKALQEVLDNFGKFAKQNHVSIAKKISQVSSEKVGGYYRMIFQWSGAASYKDFVQFVGSIHDAKLMVALKRCALTAKSTSSIGIESQFIVTAKE